MKLRKLSVNQFKRFTVPTQLGELGDGLNLVVGPNELGKSSLLDALRAVLFERYNSKARPIMALQNDRSGAAPVVELVFEVNGTEYTLTKRFVRNPLARLQCPDGTLLEAGVIDTKTNYVEHPEVVADRLRLAVRAAGGDPTRVMAGTDCGFDTSAGSNRVDKGIVWLKLRAMREGADIASHEMF